MSLVRRLVSQDKIRYNDTEYDIDLAYITQNIIAMGFPASGFESTYRNPIELEKYIYDSEGTQVLFNWTGNNTFSVDTIERALRYSVQGYKICSHCHRPIKDNEKFYQEWSATYCEDCKDLCGEMDTTGD